MLIKFSKQIVNNFAKIIYTKVNSKPCHTAEMNPFWQVATAFRGELVTLPYICDEVFCDNSKKTKSRSLFLQKPPTWMFDKVLNTLLNWPQFKSI